MVGILEGMRIVEGSAFVAVPLGSMTLALLGADVSTGGFDGRNAFVPYEGTRRQFFSTWYEDSPIGYVDDDRKLVVPGQLELCREVFCLQLGVKLRQIVIQTAFPNGNRPFPLDPLSQLAQMGGPMRR